MRKICWVYVTLAKRACRSCVSVCSCATSSRIHVPAPSEPTWTAITKWRNKVRHRVAGNRMSMPEPRRRSARRNLMAGLIRYDRIETTEARARAIRGEVEKLIDTAVKGRQEARRYLLSVVTDEDKATQVLAFARRGRFSLDAEVASNEERAERDKPPLTDKGRKFLENKLKGRRDELLRIIGNEDEAEEIGRASCRERV